MQDTNVNVQAEESDSTASLVSWKNPPKLNDLKQNLTDAQSSQKLAVSKIDTWLDNLHVRGKAEVKGDGTSSKIVPRLIRKQAEWRYAALSEPFLSTEDVFNIKPVTWEDQKAANQNELLLNYQFNCLLGKQTFIDEFVRTAVDEGTVIVRIGWDYQEEVTKVKVPEVEFMGDPTYAEELQGYMELQQANPSAFARLGEEFKVSIEMSQQYQMPMRPNVVGFKEEERTRIVHNKPSLEVCDYRNVTIDPTCKGDIKKARFVIHSFETNLDTLRKDGKYVNLDRIQIDNANILGAPDHTVNGDTGSFNFVDNPRKKFIVHEYWGHWDIDDNGTTKSIVMAWVGNSVIRIEENPYPDGELPFVTCQYLPVRKSIYGEPDGALLEENQKVAGAVMRGMIDLMGKSANGQTGVRKDMLDATNKKRFMDGKDYEFNPSVDPRQGVYMHTFGEIPSSAQYMLSVMQMEAESLTGVKAYTDGIASQSLGDVAAGIRGALDAASKRELGILRRISSSMCDIARKIIAMNAMFLSDQEVVRVTNEEFVTIDREDLPGNFDLKVTVSTAEEDNNKAQEISFMLQTMGNTVDMGVTQILLGKLFKLRKMPDVAKMIEEFKPQPDPIAEELKKLELEKAKAIVADEIAQAQLRQAEAQLAMAKVQTELAKAANIQSDTDMRNLDFAEQESGVKQERDLQKQGAQAQAQAGMKIIDNQMKSQENDKAFVQTAALNEQKAQHDRTKNNSSGRSKFVRVN